ncbi:S8 family peptidase [Roseateles toxinivorans]|uniref:Peptidase MprA n=1 Tax=Roseateles toxinivorans TaxID=270368 RepID=A0A4R6QQD9_9BURK|nr:S8 family peptidase [Roseateles toxinivorans]TDP72933.1 peptidase MprA [Roseateles toxinivorans]
MKLLRSLLLGTAVTAMLPLPIGSALAFTPVVASSEQNARLIVRFKATAASVRAKALSANASASDAASTTQRRALSLGQRMGVTLAGGRAVDERTQVVTASGVDAVALVKRLSQDAEVEWVAVDQRRKHYAVPNDPLFETVPAGNGGPVSGQWYLKAPDAGGATREGGNIASSINALGAWERTTGSASIVVAVLDSGVRYDHPDLAGKLLPGYDMIEQTLVSNDGDGRDSDANDAGDWLTSTEKAANDFYKDCEVENSSWHGTQVAGLIGAATNNNVGMAGVSWGSKILPVRVLGKCGGYDSDIVAGMQWAAGIAVPGVPANPNPARVLNMSLGGVGTCQGSGTPALYREAITAITAKGAVVVVAAGNSTGHAINLPANCPGVVGVVALRHIGTKVGFSDIGPEVTIAAPGGNCVNIGPGDACMYPMLSTFNAGTTAPGASNYTDSFRAAVGTSFSAPLVSGTIALMLSQKPSLAPAEVISLLKSTARAFPSSGAANNADGEPIKQCVAPNGIDQLECYCTTTTCGAGMLDASAAVAAVTTAAQARITSTPAAPQAGDAIQLSASTSAAATGRTIAGYAWTLVSGGGIVSGFSSATNASTAALAAATGAGTVTVRLQITDDRGAATASEATITVAAAPVVVPPPVTSSGGGGAMSWAWLLGLALAVLGLARQRRIS